MVLMCCFVRLDPSFPFSASVLKQQLHNKQVQREQSRAAAAQLVQIQLHYKHSTVCLMSPGCCCSSRVEFLLLFLLITPPHLSTTAAPPFQSDSIPDLSGQSAELFIFFRWRSGGGGGTGFLCGVVWCGDY